MRKLAFAVDACRTLCWCKKVRGEAPLFTLVAAQVDELRGATHAPRPVSPQSAAHWRSEFTPKAAGGAGRLLRTGFVTAAERHGTERSHASYTTSTTCNLHSFTDNLFVSMQDTRLKETRAVACARRRRSASQLTPSQLTPSQINSKPARSSQFAPSQFSELA